jgi:dihydroorotase
MPLRSGRKPRLVLRSARVIDPSQNLNRIADLYVADGRVVSIGSEPPDFTPDHELVLARQFVCPGLVDLSARVGEPGHEHKGTIASETEAAAAAGITTLCCPPDTEPVIDTPAVLELIRHRTEQSGKAKILPLGALTRNLEGTELSEMAALKSAGCVAVSNAQRPIPSTLVLRRAMEYAATFSLPVFLDAEDAWLRDDGCVHEGAVSARLGLPGIPEAAETVALARHLALVEQTGVRAHFCRLSSARAVRMITRSQRDGLAVSADTTAHHLHLSEMNVAEFDSNCHVSPPLRTVLDREGLRSGIAQGTLQAICSDHQPHEADAKLAPFPSTAPGISALETLLPLTLCLVEEGVLPLEQAIARLTCGPARILGIRAGTMRPDAPADICVFDPEHVWTLDPETVVSWGHNTPFAGREFRGRVTHTLLDGELVFTLDSD